MPTIPLAPEYGLKSFAVAENTRAFNFQADWDDGPFPEPGDVLMVWSCQQGTSNDAPSPAGWTRELENSDTTLDGASGGVAMHMKIADGTEGSVTFINASSTLEVMFVLCLTPLTPVSALATAVTSNSDGVGAGESGDVTLNLDANTAPLVAAINFIMAFSTSPDLTTAHNDFGAATPDVTLSGTDGNLRASIKLKHYWLQADLVDNSVGMSGGDHGSINGRMSARVQL